MSEQELIELEEEEYTSQLTGPVLRRILGLIRPHWKWALGFVIAIALTSSTDAYFTYINKQFVDQGINFGDSQALLRLGNDLRRHHPVPGRHGLHLCLPGRRARRAHPVRPAQDDVQPPAGSLAVLLRTERRRPADRPRDLRHGAALRTS